MAKDMVSNIRSVEAVNRAAKTIFKEIRAQDKDPVQILINKQFLDFQEKNNIGLLFVPKDELYLQRGDFDIIILHPALGYIHLEVKAFGDAQDHFCDQKKLLELVKVLQEKTVDKLQKGRQVLQYLQPAPQKVNIVNTVALPNVSRADLKRALDHEPELRKTLAKCISEETLGQVAVEDLCLCSDDLPPKDSVVDEADRTVMNAFNKWWSAITAICTKPKCSPESYRCILASFFNNEQVKNLSEYVHDMGEKFEDLQLDEQQAKVVDRVEQYMYIAGAPGSGKTVVLAKKTAQWLRAGQHVFMLHSNERISNQPASEFLLHFVETIMGEESPRLHRIDITKLASPQDVVTEIRKVKNDPKLGKVPRSAEHKQHDIMFNEIARPDVTQFFTKAALEVKQKSDPTGKMNVNICIVIDGLHQRTISWDMKELFKAIKQSFPAAKIWCSGLFLSHRPQKDFNTVQLHLPYRCTPKTQRLLQALEPFCRGEQQRDFQYVTSCTRVVTHGEESVEEYQHRLPDDGPDPVFYSHDGHGPGEIMDCDPCVRTLVDYLKNELRIGQNNPSGKDLKESDVLITVSSTALYRKMENLKHTLLYNYLTRVNFKVNVYNSADAFQLQEPGICMMHSRLVAGVEKKVVISIPCKQFQPQPMTYAEVVRRPERLANDPATGCQTGPSLPQHRSEGSSCLAVADNEDNSQPHVRNILQNSNTLTRDQVGRLSRLGRLNLHWLWYSVCRSSSHNIIFHF